MQVKQSSAVAHFLFLMVDSTDHVTGKTGLTPTVTISKNAAAFASPAGAVTEVSGGWYKLAANATDSNTLGVLALHATGTGADPTDMILANIVAYDPQAAGVTVTTNNDKTGYALSAGGVQAIWDALTSALTTASSIGKKLADWVIGTTQTGDSFARLGAPAGASVSADIAAAKVDTAAIKVKTDFLPSATAGAAGGVFIAGSNAATTVNITGNLTGNVTGSVGSVTGAVGSVTGAVGSVTGAVGSVTGNVGGNVTGSVGSVASGGITEASYATTAGTFYPLGIIDQGTAQSATGTTLVLRAAAAFASSELVGAMIVITGGSAGVGQSRWITAYNGGTDTATVDTWTTTPTGTITYKIVAAAPAPATPPAVNVTQVIGDPIITSSSKTTNWGGT